jgi:hypothetical protein
VGLLLVTASACGSDEDSSSDTAAPADSVAVADPPVDTDAADSIPAETAPTDSAPTDSAPTDSGPAGGGDATAVCGDLSAADVGGAVGAEFDSADDISIDTDVSCLFSSSMDIDGVTVMTQSVDTYLGGMLAGLPVEEALAQLESAQSTFLDEGYVVEQATIGGSPAIVITGTNAMLTTPTGYASTVIDGVVIEVTLDGLNLSPDAAGLGPLASAVLELAVGAQA